MKIIVDIGHPAHVHLFRNFVSQMQINGNQILFVCRDREHVISLLKYYGFIFRNLGRHYISVPGKIYGLMINSLQLLVISLKFKPDLFISHGSTIGGFVSFLVRKPHLALEDTFNMEQVRLSMLFTEVVLTGDYPHPDLGKKEIRYPGYHELAYLHPNVYTPDEKVLDSLGIKKGEKYAIVRFVAWNASHDIGLQGISFDNKLKLILELSRILKVFISAESEIPQQLKEYQISIEPEQIHDALSFASLFIGESATMVSECAMLGTPAIYINNSQLGYIKEQIKYGVVVSYTESPVDQEKAINKAVEFAQTEDLKSAFISKRDMMLADKIDVTAFLVWFVEKYPGSLNEMRHSDFNFERFR